MAIIFTESVSPDKELVYTTYYREEYLSKEDQAKGIIVPEIPEPEIIPGKNPVRYYQPSTQTIYYEYVDAPKTENEKIEEQGQLIADLTYQLMLKGVL